jgi:cytochrome P450
MSTLPKMTLFQNVGALLKNTNYAIGISLILLAIPILYRIYFHPLSHIPGPWFAKVSPLFLWIICYLGIEGRVLRSYHTKYNTKVLRVAPNSLSISDSAAVQPIYIAGGGYEKDIRYANFNLGPFASIFSATDSEYRDARAKVVAPLFAPARLRAACEPNGVIKESVAEYVRKFQAYKAAAVSKKHGVVKVDMLDLAARLSIDVVTGYLLNEPYGGLHENDSLPIATQMTKKLSANAFIFAIIGFSRFSLLPRRLFGLAYSIASRLSNDEEVNRSAALVDQFAEGIVKKSLGGKPEDSYQGRLMAVGVPPHEAAAQAKGIIFAGADSVSVTLSTILFHLVQKPEIHARLLNEIRRDYTDRSKDPETLPYLRAVVKEGLRVCMANPTRYTRVVPNSGLTVGSIYIPPKTVVGCAAYTMHHDEEVFPRPFEFLPERWLEDGGDKGLRTTGMHKSMLAFGAGLRGCIGKNLAQRQLYESVVAVVDGEILEGARTVQQRIEIIEWFNAEIKGHKLEIEWS